MSDNQFTSLEQQASYGIGRQMGDQLAQNGFEGIDLNAVAAGIKDAYEGEALAVPAEQIQAAFNEINRRIQEARQAAAKAASAEGEAFLAENAKRDAVTQLESGLQYEVLEAGDTSQQPPQADNTVRVHYHGTFIDGRKFDSSYERGQPAEFPVRGVIAGWTEALQLMHPGAKWKLAIPYHLAYGEQGSPGGIPPYATLLFDVELLEVL